MGVTKQTNKQTTLQINASCQRLLEGSTKELQINFKIIQSYFFNSIHCSFVYSTMQVKISSTSIDINTFKIHVDSHKHKLKEEI